MPTLNAAARAYRTGATHRSMREQQADVFRHVNGALKTAARGDDIARARALADNRRLWNTVINLMYDPANPLPQEIRASIVSIGLAVQRNMDADAPNFDFLITTNENIAAGLSA